MPVLLGRYLPKPSWNAYTLADHLQHMLGWQLSGMNVLPETKMKVFKQADSTLVLHDHRTTGVVFLEIYDVPHASLDALPEMYQEADLPSLTAATSEQALAQNIERIALSYHFAAQPWKQEFLQQCLLHNSYTIRSITNECMPLLNSVN